MLRSLLFLTLFSFSASAMGAVWNEQNSWSSAYEARFAAWVRAEWQVDYFSRKTYPNGRANPWVGLRLDCADTVYAMRIIFAYENRLPFVVKDPTSSQRTISNQMSRWDGQAEVTRVRNFLLYMFDMMSTRSLPNDTYPMAINKDTVRPGSLILTTTVNHHSWTVKDMLAIGVPHLVFNSTIGATSGSKLQERQSWPNPAWVFEGNFTPAGNAGFRYWRPAAYILRPVWEVPGYSEEQYKIPLNNWVRTVQTRLASKQEADESKINRLAKSACDELTQRVSAVQEGLTYLRKNPRCMDYATYDTYSTPSRDQRSFDALMALRQAYKEMVQSNGGSGLGSATKERMNKIFPYIGSTAAAETSKMDASAVSDSSMCVVNHLAGKRIDLADFKRRLFAGLISNNPHDGAEYRWGEVRGKSELARNCPSWDPWSPSF